MGFFFKGLLKMIFWQEEFFAHWLRHDWLNMHYLLHEIFKVKKYTCTWL